MKRLKTTNLRGFLKMEIWKKITSCDGYEASNFGQVRSYRSPSGHGNRRTIPLILKPILNARKYHMINLGGKNRKLSRVICETFYGNSELQVNHKNGIKTDDRLENLEYCTASKNVQHAFDTGLRPKGFGTRGSNLTEQDLKKICQDLRSTRQIASNYGVSQVHISRIKRFYRGFKPSWAS